MPHISAASCVGDGTRDSTSPMPTPRSIRPSRSAPTWPEIHGIARLDKLGGVFVSNGISADHQKYLALGGLGFLLGDGALNYGRENIVESLLQRACVARNLRRRGPATHQQSRLQSRPRPSAGSRFPLPSGILSDCTRLCGTGSPTRSAEQRSAILRSTSPPSHPSRTPRSP